MTNTNFNILIGANTTKLSSDIKGVMDSIGALYPVKVEAVLSNESEIHGQIENIAKKLRALGNVNVGLSDGKLGNIDKDLSKAGSEAQKVAKSMDNAFDGMSKEVKEATKNAENLLKVTEKINAQSKKTVKATTVKGNDFFTEKTTSVLPDEGDKLAPESIEKTFDHKKLSKYINSVNDDLAKWGHTVDLSGEKIERIKNLIATIDSQYKIDPQGAFVKDLKNIEAIHKELTQVSNVIDKQMKESAKHLVNIKKANLSMLKNDDVTRLSNDGVDLYNESNLYKDKDYWSDGHDDKFFENLEYQQRKLEENIKLNKELKQRQQEIDKTAKGISASIEKWKENGLLANTEIKKIEDTLSGLSRHSESFQADLKAIQKQAKDLSVQEQAIVKKQKDDEQARLKIQKAQIEYEKKINKLKEDGYYNHLQLKTLEKSYDKLHDGQARDLKQVNKLLDELNTKYAKTAKYADDVKRKSALSENVRNAKNRLGNIDPNLITSAQGQRDYRSYENHVQKLESPDVTNKAKENSLKRLNELYAKLIQYQKQSVNLENTVVGHENSLEQATYQLNQQLKDSNNIERVQGMINNLSSQLGDIRRNNTNLSAEENREIQKQIQSIQRTTSQLRGVETEMRQINNQTQSITEKLESMRYRATRGFNNSSRQLRQITQEFDAIETRRQQLLTIDTSTDTGRDNYRREYAEIERMMNEANRNSSNLRDEVTRQQNSTMGRIAHAFRQVPIWMSAMSVFYGLTTQIQQGFQSMLDIDEAMINLTKVTDATNSELERFKENASAIGNELGVLTADVINSTAEFQKLGYSLAQSSALATNSILYANVGDMNIDDATSYMVSSIKGFNIEVDKSGKAVEKVIDIFNAVSNNYAISAEGIGQALQRSSAVLTQAGNTIEQSVALVTSANTTIQDPMKVGNALKTISMRLRGVDEEGGKVTELVPELEKTFNSFGATIMEDADTFKTTFDIMDTLRQHWDDLTDIEQANITELIGGKEQGAIVASMIANWGDALGSYETALNSSGSAQREFQKYTEGFAYKINSLKVALEELWTTMMEDRAFKNAIDSLTGLVHSITWVVERLGSIPFIMGLATMGILAFSKTIRGAVGNTSALSIAVGDLANASRRGQRTASGMATAFGGFAKTLGKTIGRFVAFTAVIMGVSWAIGKVIDWTQKDDIAREENIRRIDDQIMKYEELKANMADFDMSRFEKLSVGFENNSLGNEEMKEYLALRDVLIDEMPELIQGYDENGNAIIKNAESVKELIRAKDELYATNLREKAKLTVEDMDTKSLEKQINETNRLMNELEFSNEEEEAYTFIEDWVNQNSDAIDKGGEELRNKLGNLYNDVSSILSSDNINKGNIMNSVQLMQVDLDAGNYESVFKTIDHMKNGIKLRSADLATEIENSKSSLENEMTDFTIAMDTMIESSMLDMGIEKNSNQYLFVNEMRDSIIDNIYTLSKDHELEDIVGNIPTWIQTMLEEAEKADVDIDKLFDFSLEGDALIQEFDKFIASFEMSGKEGKVFIDMLKQLRLESIQTAKTVKENPIKPFETMEKSIVPQMDTYYQKIQDLDDAYRRLAEGERLSNSEVLNLVKNHPQLNKSLTTQNGYLSLNKQALQAVAGEHQNSVKVQIASAKASVQTAKDRAFSNIKAIYSEIKAEELLSKTRAEVLNKALNEEAKKRAEDGRHLGYGEAVHMGTELGKAYDDFHSFADELSQLDSLLNSVGNVSLGNITSGYKPESSSSKNSAKDQAKSMQDAIYIADKYKLKMDELNASIEMLQKRRENMNNVNGDIRHSLQQEINLTKQKSDAIKAEIASIEKQIKTKTIQEKGLIQLGKDDNRTARAKSAELTQQIDELKGSLSQLKSEAEDVKNTAIALNMTYIETWTGLYALEREVLTDDISYQDYLMSMYDKNSKAFKASALEKIRLMKVQEKFWQKELEHLENQRKIGNLTDAQVLDINQKIRDAREGLYNINKDIIGEDTALKQIEIDFKTDAFDNGMDKFDKTIKESEKALKALDKEDYAGQAKIQEDITASYRGQAKYIKDVIKELEAMKISNAGNFELTNSINDEIKKWKDSLEDIDDSITNSVTDLKSIYEELADEAVEAHKEGIQMQMDAQEDMFEDMMEGYEEVHSKKMEQYEKELEILSDIYDQQVEMIDREDATRTYDNTLEKLRKEADKLQKQIDVLALDNSFDSVSKREDLQGQLNEKNEEINELQYQREKDLRIESLEDAKEVETEKLETKKNTYEEEYEEMVRLKEKEHELTIKSLEERLNDERFYSKLREDVMNGEFTEISSMMEEFTAKMDYYSKHVGNSLTQNLIDKLADAMKGIKELNSLSLSSGSGSGGSGKVNNVTTVANELNEKGGAVVQTPNAGGLGTSSGNKAQADSSKSTNYSTGKVVRAKWDCWLFSTTSKDEAYKMKKLPKGSQWVAKGENSGFYMLGSGYSDKGNFDVVANTSSGTSGSSTTGSGTQSNQTPSGSSNSSSQRFYTVKKNDTLSDIAQQYYGKASEWKKIQNANPSVNPNKMQIGTKLLIPFRTGGYTGEWSGDEGRLAVLHKKEQVLDANQTNDLFKTIEKLEQIKRMKVQSANINLNNEKPVQQVTNEYNITLEIENMNGDKKSADIVSDQILQNMKRTKGGRFY